ncbi:asparagine synthase (glutamine-hydrolyzing) [Mongoliitalea lutea]|uniref:asparagine synthase (glutamine-hydrolyzing) n=1 Tax=Mongoliitalea lutea TaxID=849756 RepID=A0A8J3G5I2_9BACT|nr:asparagine synthase (glutamine-hydrolyzing) [Mongoliitalea lutea]GHB37231.1 asparagine synthetase B [Mongoliitalea lutea]
MCGISGYISKNNNFDINDLRRINDQMNHRGPDEDGVYAYLNLGIGHKRLSIIDLSSGQQPMKNDDESLIISYNGELYNYLEIKDRLIKFGLKFHTSSDTEVILKAYQHYGKTCVQHFRGMFAFSIIDKLKQEVFIARDHLGIKPVVYYEDANSFSWASEINALKSTPNFITDIDLYAIDQYLTYQYIPAPRTAYRKIKKLLPGHYMVVDFEGNVKANRKYWDIHFKAEKKSKDFWLNELENELRKSVALHTVSDVEFGAFLSGGIDSTLVVKYMTEQLGTGIKTYTIGFKDSSVNETNYAQQVANKFKTDHTCITLEGDALEVLPLLVKHYGEPFGDFSAIPTFYVSELASKDVKMVLSGDGADEAFAGYGHYPIWLQKISSHQSNAVFKNKTVAALYPLANKIYPKRYPKLSLPFDDLAYYLRYRERMDSTFREQLWKNSFKFLIDLPNEIENLYGDRFRDQNKFNRSQFFDIKVFMPDDILTKVDVASMINSLEVRTPITDKAVFELAATIPSELLLTQKDGNWQGKSLLKKLLSKDFDLDFIERKKQGFEIPLDKWLFDGSNLEKIQKRFYDPDGLLNRLFDLKMLEKILIEKKGYYVWLLLVLDEWFRQNEG